MDDFRARCYIASMRTEAVLILLALTGTGMAVGKFDRAALSAKTEKLLDTRNSLDFQKNADALQKEGLLKHAYLYEMEKGFKCDPTNLSKLDRIGATATIENYISDFNLLEIYACPSFSPRKFCAAADKAVKEECFSGWVSSFGMILADFPSALERARLNGKKVGPLKDEKVGGEMQMMYMIRWIANAYPTYHEFLKAAEAKCGELDAEACHHMSSLHMLRDVGRATIKPTVKELKEWKNLGPHKSLTEMIQKYHELWK